MEDEGYLVVTLIKDVLNASPEKPVELFVDYNYTTSKQHKANQRAMKKKRKQLNDDDGDDGDTVVVKSRKKTKIV